MESSVYELGANTPAQTNNQKCLSIPHVMFPTTDPLPKIILCVTVIISRVHWDICTVAGAPVRECGAGQLDVLHQ